MKGGGILIKSGGSNEGKVGSDYFRGGSNIGEIGIKIKSGGGSFYRGGGDLMRRWGLVF